MRGREHGKERARRTAEPWGAKLFMSVRRGYDRLASALFEEHERYPSGGRRLDDTQDTDAGDSPPGGDVAIGKWVFNGSRRRRFREGLHNQRLPFGNRNLLALSPPNL
jgi:hypothetical protein